MTCSYMCALVYVHERSYYLDINFNMKKNKIHIKIPKVLPRNPAALSAKMRYASVMTNRNEKRSKEQESCDIEDCLMICKECHEEYFETGGEPICSACANNFCSYCGGSLEDPSYGDICFSCSSF